MSLWPHSPVLDSEGKVFAATDWLGNQFSVGEEVMYCIGAGRGQMMAIGTVQEMRVKTMFHWTADVGRHEVDVVEVKVLTSRTSGHWNNRARTKPVWVNEMNITSMRGWNRD